MGLKKRTLPKLTVSCLVFALFRAPLTFSLIGPSKSVTFWIDISSVLEGQRWCLSWALVMFEPHILSQHKISTENYVNK